MDTSQNNESPNTQNNKNTNSKTEDKPTIGLSILSFFIPLVGIILAAGNWKSKPISAKRYLIVSVVSVALFIFINIVNSSNSISPSNSCSIGSKCKVGDIITFGHYEQDNDTTNGPEPIEWRVLDIDSNGHLLIISDKVLDQQQYNTKEGSIFWEKSTIRSWLNGYGSSHNKVGTDYTNNNFIDTAFTPNEKARIITSSLCTCGLCKATSDKIFLLNLEEAKSYFTTKEDRKAYATLYAVNHGANAYNFDTSQECSVSNFVTNRCSASWWLLGCIDYIFVGIVNQDGSANNDIFTYPTSINGGITGVRPALWVNWLNL